MTTRPNVQADSMADANCVLETDNTVEVLTETDRGEAQLFRTVSKVRDIAPVAHIPPSLAENSKARNLRRILTREQGRALEMIGHAVDYLNDCYLYEGDEHELINMGGSSTQALEILSAARRQILQSAPLQEPRMHRLWNALFHRNPERRPGTEFHRREDRASQSKPTAVLPLSSSR
ncbi:MAG: hypothetical protein ACLQMO_06655 [Acidobacteriaceae bacterium]